MLVRWETVYVCMGREVYDQFFCNPKISLKNSLLIFKKWVLLLIICFHYQLPLPILLTSQLQNEPLIWEFLSSLKWKLWLNTLNISLRIWIAEKNILNYENIFSKLAKVKGIPLRPFARLSKSSVPRK